MLDKTIKGIFSPCNGFCEIDPKSNLCKGCYRTISEITSWQSYSEGQKKEVLLKVLKRRENTTNK